MTWGTPAARQPSVVPVGSLVDDEIGRTVALPMLEQPRGDMTRHHHPEHRLRPCERLRWMLHFEADLGFGIRERHPLGNSWNDRHGSRPMNWLLATKDTSCPAAAAADARGTIGNTCP